MVAQNIIDLLRRILVPCIALVWLCHLDQMLFSSANAQVDSNSFPLRLHIDGSNVRLRWASQSDERFRIEHQYNLQPGFSWLAFSTNWPAAPGPETEFVHTNALNASAGFYRVARLASPPEFAFDWNGTNFTYTDSIRTFTGIC